MFVVMFGGTWCVTKNNESDALREAHRYVRKQPVITIFKSGKVIHKWENGKKVDLKSE